MRKFSYWSLLHYSCCSYVQILQCTIHDEACLRCFLFFKCGVICTLPVLFRGCRVFGGLGPFPYERKMTGRFGPSNSTKWHPLQHELVAIITVFQTMVSGLYWLSHSTCHVITLCTKTMCFAMPLFCLVITLCTKTCV